MQGMDTYSNILYVKDDFAGLSAMAHRAIEVTQRASCSHKGVTCPFNRCAGFQSLACEFVVKCSLMHVSPFTSLADGQVPA